MNKPEYTFSDLVHIAGYGSRVFKIESYRVEQCFSPSEEWTDIVYDLIDTETGAYVECDEEDLRLADGSSMRKPTARELSGQARKDRAKRVDELLDAMNDTKVLVEMFPEDDEFKAKVEYLTIKLAEVTAE
ncbi:hypothetical protein [Mesobacillus zeae]|uniref:hypothetical protein n=1 Tax=Mesobacillus zeae TaxID=1917180 RepID=UPI00300A88B8